jgi:hypothetical protein
MRAAHIAAIRELGDVFPKMLAGNVNMSATNGAFQLAPMTLNRIGVNVTVNPNVGRVIDAAVLVANPRKIAVGAMFVRADRRATLHMTLNKWLNRLSKAVRDRARNDAAVTLQHANNKRGLCTWDPSLTLAVPDSRYPYPSSGASPVRKGNNMQHIGEQASLFIIYAKLLWLYWLAAMGTLAVVWGEHAERFKRANSMQHHQEAQEMSLASANRFREN